MAQPAPIAMSEGGPLDRIPWYLQLLILVGLILIVLFAVDYFWLKPLRDEAAIKDQEAQRLKVENQEADIIATNIKEFEERLDELNAQLDTMKVRLPEQREISNIFDNAKTMVANSGLKLDVFDTNLKDKGTVKEYYTEVPVGMKVTGTYPKVQNLFQTLAAYERIVNVTDIAVSRLPDAGQAIGDTTTASFTLTAFYISDQNRRNLEASTVEEGKDGSGADDKKDGKKKEEKK